MESRPALHSRKPWLPLLVTLALMAGLGGWVGWQWQALETRSLIDREQRFTYVVNDIERTLRERMRAYEMVLRGLAGLVAGAERVDVDDWMRAIDQLQLQDIYPGIQAVSFARYARQDTLTGVVDMIRERGRPQFRMYPEGARDEYVVVDYIHPLDWRNRRVLGFDMFSEPTRRAAIVQARNTGNPVLTGPLRLKQETEQDVQIGVLLFLPVYASNAPITTEAERQRAFIGTLHGAFRLTDLMEGVLGARSEMFEIQLYDSAEPDLPLLAGRGPVSDNAVFKRVRNIHMYGRSWQLVVASTPEYVALLRDNRMTFSLFAALTAVVLFSLLVGGYLFLRERQLASSEALSQKLQEREALFRQLIEQLPIATLLGNSKGRIELANQSAGALLGCSVDQLLGERVSRYLPGVLTEAELEGPRKADQEELQAQREDGELVPVAVSLTSFRREDGMHHLLNLVDMQARKRAEERFRNVVEASPNAFVLISREGTIVMVNRQTEVLFGYERHELLGERVEILLPDVLRETHKRLREDYWKHPEPRRMGSNRELFGRHRDGSLLPLEIGLSPMRSGNEMLVQAVIMDISHRRAAELRLRDQADQLAVANRYKSEFLANMSHELRTPLNSILILSDQLRHNSAGNLTEKQVRHAEIMHRAGTDLLQLINDVLDLARIEAGSMQLKTEPVAIDELLRDVENTLQPMAQEKGLALGYVITPGVPTTVLSDRARLQQVLHNLMSNAVKFTEQGRVEVRLSCGTSDRSDCESLRIDVSDTGIGIPEEEHERVFQAFQQIDGSISRRYGGTGLGLAITRQLVEVLEGQIELRSTPGQGSVFTVVLPVRKVETKPALEVTARPVREGRGPLLLVVEDDADFASVVAEAAQSHGYTPLLCGTGQQALDALRQERFAAVVLDVLLPDLSGWQVYRELRADPRHFGVPVTIISAVPQPHDWKDAGARYLVKPVQRGDIERLFVELNRYKDNPLRLLLVERDQARRQRLRDYLEQLGYSVTIAGSSDEARLAFAEQLFSAVAIDQDLPQESGLDLLDALNRLRPVSDMAVIVYSARPLDEQDLQRVRRYSAVALSKDDSLERVAQALRPGSQSAVIGEGGFDAPLLGQQVLLAEEDVRSLYALTALLDELGLQVTPAMDSAEALARFDEGAFDLVMVGTGSARLDGPGVVRELREGHGCQVPIIAVTVSPQATERMREAGASDVLPLPADRTSLGTRIRQWLGRASETHAGT
ncbi:CHASE domain-containing protein [Stutzerimonas urumqiensis]|uniref:CHASE domain-containing protein n=1 Tax=Stutzerimonas urumqiensis TaxID=638269 RepID=UPI003DA4FF2B